MRKSRQIIAYLGVSIDGRIAGMGHDIDWLLDYDPYEFGFADFLANVDTLIAGRTSFEIMRHDWAYGDRRCLVISRTPLDQDSPPNCVAVLSPGEAVAEARRLARKDIWVVGGGLTIGGLLDLDAIDRLGDSRRSRHRRFRTGPRRGQCCPQGMDIDRAQAAVKLYPLHLPAGSVTIWAGLA